jgi:Flp pilus assembly protein TadD
MAPLFRGIFLASLSVSIIALAGCGTTGSNVSNVSESNRVNSILERAAREARASGNKAETVVLLENIYQRNPDDAAVATSFGQALREDEQLNRARQVLYPFTEGKNAYPDAVVELAMVQLSLGQYKEAELTSRRAVEMDQNSGRAYLALGTALDAQNYHEQAEVAFRRGIDKWKGDPAPIMNNLALNLASQNKLDQAIDMLKKAKEISPGRVELERNMRIISTLKEGADDFLVKQDNVQKEAAAKKQESPAPEAVKVKADKKPAEKPEEKKDAAASKTTTVTTVKKETVKTVKTAEPQQEDIDNKQLDKPAEKPSPKAVVKKTVKTAPEKVEPAASTNARGSTQNFNPKSSTND